MWSMWVKLPVWWIVSSTKVDPLLNEPIRGLRLFSQQVKGNSIAALKVYISLLLQTDNNSSSETYGKVGMSIADIEGSTGLSREKIVAGVRLLEFHSLISVDRGAGRKNIFSICGYDRVPWVKIPKTEFADGFGGGSPLRQISTRGKVSLNALKLYLFLTASVDKSTLTACRTYQNIENNTGIRRNDIRPAISLLINLDLVKVSNEKIEGDYDYNSPNIYHIVGLKYLTNSTDDE